jgi:hypothetical protein
VISPPPPKRLHRKKIPLPVIIATSEITDISSSKEPELLLSTSNVNSNSENLLSKINQENPPNIISTSVKANSNNSTDDGLENSQATTTSVVRGRGRPVGSFKYSKTLQNGSSPSGKSVTNKNEQESADSTRSVLNLGVSNIQEIPKIEENNVPEIKNCLNAVGIDSALAVILAVLDRPWNVDEIDYLDQFRRYAPKYDIDDVLISLKNQYQLLVER